MPRLQWELRRWRLAVKLWVNQPAHRLWAIFTDVRLWPMWGPSIRGVSIFGSGYGVYEGLQGRAKTILGFSVPFVIDHVDPGRSWTWRVAGFSATGHEVQSAGLHASWLVFTVPLWAFFYVPVCLIAARRIALIAHRGSGKDDQAEPINGSSFSTVKNTANSLVSGSSDLVA